VTVDEGDLELLIARNPVSERERTGIDLMVILRAWAAGNGARHRRAQDGVRTGMMTWT
jgi:hypothetical protein